MTPAWACSEARADPAHSIPLTEKAAEHRVRIRKAWDILPDDMAEAMHALLVEGRDAESVGHQFSMYKSASGCRAAALTLLRLALRLLVSARWA